MYSCFGILNIPALHFAYPIHSGLEDEIPGEPHPASQKQLSVGADACFGSKSQPNVEPLSSTTTCTCPPLPNHAVNPDLDHVITALADLDDGELDALIATVDDCPYRACSRGSGTYAIGSTAEARGQTSRCNRLRPPSNRARARRASAPPCSYAPRWQRGETGDGVARRDRRTADRWRAQDQRLTEIRVVIIFGYDAKADPVR